MNKNERKLQKSMIGVAAYKSRGDRKKIFQINAEFSFVYEAKSRVGNDMYVLKKIKKLFLKNRAIFLRENGLNVCQCTRNVHFIK